MSFSPTIFTSILGASSIQTVPGRPNQSSPPGCPVSALALLPPAFPDCPPRRLLRCGLPPESAPRDHPPNGAQSVTATGTRGVWGRSDPASDPFSWPQGLSPSNRRRTDAPIHMVSEHTPPPQPDRPPSAGPRSNTHTPTRHLIGRRPSVFPSPDRFGWFCVQPKKLASNQHRHNHLPAPTPARRLPAGRCPPCATWTPTGPTSPGCPSGSSSRRLRPPPPGASARKHAPSQ